MNNIDERTVMKERCTVTAKILVTQSIWRIWKLR